MMKLTGACHCGLVQYEFDVEPSEWAERRSDCTCLACRRATGALSVPYICFSPSAFRIVSGTAKEFVGQTGEGCDASGRWLMCPTCGTNVLWKEASDDFWTALVGTINEVDEAGNILAADLT